MMFKVTHVLCFSRPEFPFRVTGRVLAPVPATYKQRQCSSPGRASSSQDTILSIWGFGTLLKGTTAVLQMCARTSSGAGTSSNFLSLVPQPPPLPSLVPYRLTSTSLIFLPCCCFSVIVRGININTIRMW